MTISILFPTFIQFSFKTWFELIQAKFVINLFDIMLLVLYQASSIILKFFTLACNPMLFLTFLSKIAQFHSGILAWIYSGQNLSVRMHLSLVFSHLNASFS